MPFTNPEFPGQLFRTIEELEKARAKRQEVEEQLSKLEDEVTTVTATVLPAPKGLLETKVAGMDKRLRELSSLVRELLENSAPKKPAVNSDGLKVGEVFRGESWGTEYTLEVLEEGYLCSNGEIYDTLSGAALGVSGNRRSGWKFWRNVAGIPVGEITGRFKKNGDHACSPFGSR